MKIYIFIATPMKYIFSSSFYERVFFSSIFRQEIYVMGLVPKYYVLAADANQVSKFFLT